MWRFIFQTCCPQGYACATGRCVADNRSAHPWDAWQPLYNLCPSSLPSYSLSLPSTDWTFPYYASAGPLCQSLPGSHIEVAVLVLHGANRNADDYYCSMVEAARLQGNWETKSVAVFAPHFLCAQDDPESGTVRWPFANDTNGVWRYGAESLPFPTGSTPEGATISSFAVLDMFLQGLMTCYPSLRRIVFTGHSSGGQAIQRQIPDVTILALRHDPVSVPLLLPPLPLPVPAMNTQVPNTSACPEYNTWEWGMGLPVPPYVSGGYPWPSGEK
eukprot:gene6267-1119_t